MLPDDGKPTSATSLTTKGLWASDLPKVAIGQSLSVLLPVSQLHQLVRGRLARLGGRERLDTHWGVHLGRGREGEWGDKRQRGSEKKGRCDREGARKREGV